MFLSIYMALLRAKNDENGRFRVRTMFFEKSQIMPTFAKVVVYSLVFENIVLARY